MYTTWGVVSVYIAKSKQLQKPLIEGLRKWMYDLKILKISLPWKYLKVKLENAMLKIVHVGYVKHI